MILDGLGMLDDLIWIAKLGLLLRRVFVIGAEIIRYLNEPDA